MSDISREISLAFSGLFLFLKFNIIQVFKIPAFPNFYMETAIDNQCQLKWSVEFK